MKTEKEVIFEMINNLQDMVTNNLVDINERLRRLQKDRNQAILYLLNARLFELNTNMHIMTIEGNDPDSIKKEIEKVKKLIRNIEK